MSVIDRDPAKAAQQIYDLVIVGGGIYGAMLLLEALRRGLRSLLVERDDFGGATSFNSLRIIHGGLRYLQDLDLHRFYESVRERRWFLLNFPDLVRPLSCLMPLYGSGLRRPSVLRVALGLNDLLSYRRNQGVRDDCRLLPGRIVNAQQTQHLFPSVDKAKLQGGAIWHDACVPNSQRLIIELLRWSCALGAKPLNYVEATGLSKVQGKVAGVLAVDQESGKVNEYRTSVVINATGPWSRITAKRFDRDEEALFRSSIAWNILLSREAFSDHALAVAPKRAGAQVYFLHPWKGRILAGTGHAPWRGEPDNPQPSGEQIANFLQDINDAVPGLNLCHKDIVRVFAGLLPAKDPAGSKLAGREVFVDHSRNGGPQGLYSLSGVKLTTARRVAEKALQRIFPRSRRHNGTESHGTGFRPEAQVGWDLRAVDAVEGRGVDWREELHRVIAQEAVVHLDDLVLRRTTLWEDPPNACLLSRQVCALFEWDSARCKEELDRLNRSLFMIHGGEAHRCTQFPD